MKPFELKEVGETLYGNNWRSALARDLTTLMPKRVHLKQIQRWLTGRPKIPGDVQESLFELVELKLKEIKRLNKK